MPIVDLLPVGDGATLGWTPVPAGTPHYLRILDYSGPDDAAGYIQTGGYLAAELFHTQTGPDIPEVVGVAWVSVRVRLRRTGVNPVNNPVWSGPLIGTGPSFEPQAWAIQYADRAKWLWFNPESDANARATTNPATGKAWTWAEALAVQVGIKDQTPDPHQLHCTSLRKVVSVTYRGVTRWDSAVRMNR